jgi:hypothetical protein
VGFGMGIVCCEKGLCEASPKSSPKERTFDSGWNLIFQLLEVLFDDFINALAYFKEYN